MKNVVLCPNPYRDVGLKTAEKVRKMLDESGIDSVICLPFEMVRDSSMSDAVKICRMEQGIKNADMIICFGGDGTILHVARDAALNRIPILGINMGNRGFMAEMEGFDPALVEKVIRGEYTIDSRMMIDVSILRFEKEIFTGIALNDAVVTKGAVARIIELAVYRDERHISTFSGDGIVISTPTGSTAYSMSAGGPIVEPDAENIIITPICAHALFAKSYVVANDKRISIKVGKLSRKSAYLSLDGGSAFQLLSDDVVNVSKSLYNTSLVHVTDKNFYDLVNHKLIKSREEMI